MSEKRFKEAVRVGCFFFLFRPTETCHCWYEKGRRVQRLKKRFQFWRGCTEYLNFDDLKVLHEIAEKGFQFTAF